MDNDMKNIHNHFHMGYKQRMIRWNSKMLILNILNINIYIFMI